MLGIVLLFINFQKTVVDSYLLKAYWHKDGKDKKIFHTMLCFVEYTHLTSLNQLFVENYNKN